MELLSKDITLGFYNDTGIINLPVSQYDTGRVISIGFTNDGKRFAIPENTSVYLKAVKPDGKQINTDEYCSIRDNCVIIEVPRQLSAVPGTVKCELILNDSAGNRYTSNRFNIIINPAVHDDENLVSTDDYKNIIDIYLELDAIKNHPHNTQNPHAVTKEQIGLGNADNTADADKPVSAAQQRALHLKADIESPILTGTPKAPTAPAGTDTAQIATTAFSQKGISDHNVSLTSHGDMRNLISTLAAKVDALEDSADKTDADSLSVNKLCFNSANGYFTDEVCEGKRLLQYTAKNSADAETDPMSKSVTLLDESGNSSFPGTVTAPAFFGNASSATIAANDRNGNDITTTYATKAEVDALKKSVSDGKSAVAGAITAKGVTTAADAAFPTMAANVGKIETCPRWKNTSNGTYKFAPNGGRWVADNRGINSSTAASTWKVTIPPSTEYTPISIGYRTATESADKLSITMNGDVILSPAGGMMTSEKTLTIEAPPSDQPQDMELTATYTKDASGHSYGDLAYVILPPVGEQPGQYKYQPKTVTPSASVQTIYPDTGYDGLYSVSVAATSGLSAPKKPVSVSFKSYVNNELFIITFGKKVTIEADVYASLGNKCWGYKLNGGGCFINQDDKTVIDVPGKTLEIPAKSYDVVKYVYNVAAQNGRTLNLTITWT